MIFDIIAILFVIIFSLWSARRGGVKAILSLMGIVLSIIVALNVYTPLSDFAYKTGFPEKIEESVFSTLKENTDADAFTALPDFIQNIISVPSEAENEVMYESIAQSVTEICVNIIVFVAALIATRLILMLVEWVLNLIMKLPVLKQLNRLIGFLCGAAISVVVVFVAVHILGIVAMENDSVASFIENSQVVLYASLVSPF